MRCIAWMSAAGRSDEYIAAALSMSDVMQVTLIRMAAIVKVWKVGGGEWKP